MDGNRIEILQKFWRECNDAVRGVFRGFRVLDKAGEVFVLPEVFGRFDPKILEQFSREKDSNERHERS